MSTYNIKKDIAYLEENGIVFGEWSEVTDEFYHGSPGISASGLKTIDKKCPAVYKYDKDSGPLEKSEALILGSAIHKYILENDDFDSEFLIGPSDKKTDRVYKIFANEHKDDVEEGGKTILRKRDGEMLVGILKSLRKARDKEGTNTYDGVIINENTKRELALYVVDEERNIILKVKVDINMAGLLLDLKSTKSADPDEFMKDAANLGYGIQAAFYLNVVKVSDLPAKMFGFIAVEKVAPYLHSVILLDEEDLALEETRVQSLLDEYAYCMNHDVWYGPNGIDKSSGAEPLFVVKKFPTWHRYKLEELNNFEGK